MRFVSFENWMHPIFDNLKFTFISLNISTTAGLINQIPYYTLLACIRFSTTVFALSTLNTMQSISTPHFKDFFWFLSEQLRCCPIVPVNSDIIIHKENRRGNSVQDLLKNIISY